MNKKYILFIVVAVIFLLSCSFFLGYVTSQVVSDKTSLKMLENDTPMMPPESVQISPDRKYAIPTPPVFVPAVARDSSDALRYRYLYDHSGIPIFETKIPPDWAVFRSDRFSLVIGPTQRISEGYLQEVYGIDIEVINNKEFTNMDPTDLKTWEGAEGVLLRGYLPSPFQKVEINKNHTVWVASISGVGSHDCYYLAEDLFGFLICSSTNSPELSMIVSNFYIPEEFKKEWDVFRR